MEEILKKSVHYAATCCRVGPLSIYYRKELILVKATERRILISFFFARYGRHENIKALINHLGDDVAINNINQKGNIALHLAALNGHLECVKIAICKIIL